MKRWNPNKQEYVERPDIDKFIEEVLELCRKHKFAITTSEFVNLLEISDYNPDKKDICEQDLFYAVDMTGDKG